MRHPAVVRALALTGTVGALALAVACHAPTAPAERIYMLEIAETRVPCVGEGQQLCLQVRERADVPYSLFYTSIRGFTYESGYRYTIQVGARPVANPPVDGSSIEYRLIAVLSRTPVSS